MSPPAAALAAWVLAVTTVTGCSWIDRVAPPPTTVPSPTESTTPTTAPEPVAEAVASSLPPGDPNASADGSPPRLTGRHGSGLYGSVVIEVIEVRRDLEVLVSVSLTNLDPINSVPILTDQILAVPGPELDPVVPSSVSGTASLIIGPSTRALKTLTYRLDADTRLNEVELHYGPESVPIRIPLFGSTPPLPYPVEVEATAIQPSDSDSDGDSDSESESESNSEPGTVLVRGCGGALGLRVDRAWVDVHLPVGLPRPHGLDPRVLAGHRWLLVDAALITGPGVNDACTPAGTGSISPARFTLRLDGRAVRRAVLPGDRIDLTAERTILAWPIPTDTTEVMVEGLVGSFTIEIPTLPPVPNE